MIAGQNINCNDYILKGEKFLQQGKFTEALEQFENARNEDLVNKEAYIKCGEVLILLRRYPEASEQFEKVLKIDPQYAPAHAWLGEVILKTGGPDNKAIEQFKKALTFDPGYAKAHNFWGNILSDKKQYQEAIEHYQIATDLDPNYPEVFNNWGITLVEMDQHEEAIKKYQEAIKIDSQNADGYINWGRALDDLERYEEALERLKKAVELDPANADAHFLCGVALTSRKYFEEAIIEFQRSIESPKDVNYETFVYSSFNIADIYMTQGRYREAREEYRKARENFDYYSQEAISCRDAKFFYNYGDLLRCIFGSLEQAEWAYKEGLKYDNELIGILLGQIELYLEEKDSATEENQAAYHWKAFSIYRQAKTFLELDNQNKTDLLIKGSSNQRSIHLAQASNCLELGRLKFMMGAHDQAEMDLRNAISLNENLEDAYNELGRVLAKKEQYKEAISHFEEAKRKSIHDLTIRSNLAETYLKADKFDQAEREYRSILTIAPRHIESLIGLGNLCLARGEEGDEDADLFSEAIQYYSKALEIADPPQGSKRMTSKDIGLVHYLRGYAWIQLFEASKIKPNQGLLWKARKDFKISFKRDPTNHKANRSMKKIDTRLGFFSPRRIGETLGSSFLVIMAMLVFFLSQSTFYFQIPAVTFDETTYIILTFGSLILIIAGMFLPQLSRLKFVGIELEKSSIDQIQTTERLGIRK